MVLIAETGVCHLHRSSHLLICILLRRERTSLQFPLPIGRVDGEAARVWLHLRQEINILKQTCFSLIVNNRWKRVQFTKRIYLNIKRQTTATHETIASYLHFLAVLLYMRFWSRELQTPIFRHSRALLGWRVEIMQCLVMCLGKTSLAMTAPYVFILLQIVLFFRKSAVNIIGTFCVIILKCLKMRYFLYFYNFGTTSSSNKLYVYL